MLKVKLPELGEGVTEGELVKWLVKVGDVIVPDQPVVEVMTDKATVEVPSPIAGKVTALHFKVGDTVKVESELLSLEANASVKTTQVQPAPVATPSPAAGGSTRKIPLPELGEGVAEGELVKWLVKVGDTITPDQPIAEVMTDKATVEVPTPVGGQVTKLYYKVGDTVKVETSLIDILVGSSQASAVQAPATAPAPIQNNAAVTPGVTKAAAIYPPPADISVLATPSTRRLAREMGVDINGLSGTGLAGRVTREDVLSTSDKGTTAPGAPSARSNERVFTAGGEERVAIKGIRKKIAENMQMAKRIVPHFTLMDEAIVTELVQAREQLKSYAEAQGTKITYLPFVMKALIATVREFNMFNASIDDDKQEIVYKNYYNVGFAADTPNGLVVPVIKNVDQKSIIELAKEVLELSKKARDGKLKPDEMKGATITVTNIGSIGGTYATPIINHPEVAILGMYKVMDKVVVGANGQFIVEKAMNFTVTADHRLIDGAVAARFLKAFIERVSRPSRLLVDLK